MEAEDGSTQWIGATGKCHVLMILTFLARQPHVSGGQLHSPLMWLHGSPLGQLHCCLQSTPNEPDGQARQMK